MYPVRLVVVGVTTSDRKLEVLSTEVELHAVVNAGEEQWAPSYSQVPWPVHSVVRPATGLTVPMQYIASTTPDGFATTTAIPVVVTDPPGDFSWKRRFPKFSVGLACSMVML